MLEICTDSVVDRDSVELLLQDVSVCCGVVSHVTRYTEIRQLMLRPIHSLPTLTEHYTSVFIGASQLPGLNLI